MRVRLGGAVGGSPAWLCTYEAFVFADVCFGERRLGGRLDFPERPGTGANGRNKQTHTYKFIAREY